MHSKNNIIRRIFLIVLAVMNVWFYAGTGTKVQAEEKEFDPTGNGAEFASVLYNNSNGLPTSEANTVLQTSDGFIWVGSYSGLIRYDGNEFYRFDSSEGITSVVSLYEDSKKRLWIGTNDNGVALYDEGVFTFYDKDDGLKSSSIRSITEDSDGNILIATTQGIAYINSEKELQSLHDSQVDGEYIRELRRTDNGLVYGVTQSGSFFTIEKLQISSFYNGNEVGIGLVRCIAPDPDKEGYVYLGTDGSELVYGSLKDGMKERKTYSVSPQSCINKIYPSGDFVWICADNGMGPIYQKNKYIELKNVPMDNSVDDMIIDHEGNIWFASSRQGLLKTAPSVFKNLNVSAGLDKMVVNSTCLYGDDLYIGTDSGLYIVDEFDNTKNTELTKMLEGVRIRCIKRDTKDNLWLCTYGEFGLICYHKDGTYELYNESTGMSSQRVRMIEELSDGSLLVSCSGGVHRIENGVLTEKLDSQAGIINTEILTIEEGNQGVIYLGSDGDGIFCVNGKKISRLGLEDGLESEVILRIKKDPNVDDLFWIITSNSIAFMQNEKITTIKDFPYSNNFDIHFDEKGGAWILSSNGIYVTGVESLLRNGKTEYTLYDTKCGLPTVTTANSYNELSEDGTLYISGTTGVCVVNINQAVEDNTDVKLVVPFVEVNGKLVNLEEGETLVLPYDCKRLKIYAYALTYALRNPRLSHYLKGFDDEPETVSKLDIEPSVYTNLDGGTYTYHLASINTLTGEEENAIDVKIIKKNAFYEYWWFYVIIVLIGAVIVSLLVLGYIRKKTEYLVRKEQEKQLYLDEMIQVFAQCIDMKDPYTNGHSSRVAKYSTMLAEHMGYPEKDVHEIHNIALLHDIGKISIPDDILNKPGRPTDEEYNVLKTHAQRGYEILKDITIDPNLAIGAGYHHERLDGKGYPHGAKQEDIPMIAQIIAVADTFDAMYSTRPYRKQMPIEKVIAELRRVSGTQLNGEVVENLAQLVQMGKIGGEVL